jgi:cyclopropane fatty-acyl-phospholipid synthase-like methyltransferase
MVGPFGYWDRLQQYQFNLLKTLGLQVHHQLLDIGCGPLQGGVAFIKYLNPNCYVGIDLRERVIEEAYLQVIREKLAAKNPFLAVADDFGKRFLTRKFDYISTFQLLYHLEEHQVDSLFQMAGDVLNQTGIFLCDIIGYPNKVSETSEWSGFKFHLHSKDFIENTSEKHGLMAESLGAIEQYGYPSEISLKTNILFKISKREMGQ